ncbi:UvrD-helicase domain-containing protein [Proteocatella sphenisci]|uniref:UvrD-helicase domain-containing protein n=1 Tax=Proteocatella sphenisci TaxID=181070 RepID=UPI0008FBF5EE|nr:ATP-dependent helicase [Proteocatella sphenisci]
MINREELIDKLKEMHGNDEEQLSFITSDEKRILITASAGCGKTKTMISKIAYEMTTTLNLNFKKILALTFSINASTKIREDTASALPNVLGVYNFNLDKKLDVSNYHSFSTKLLFKHGYSLNENLKNIENFRIVPEDANLINEYLITNEIALISDFSRAVNEIDLETVERLFKDYKNIMLNKLIPNSVITYNGLLVLGYELLKNPKIRDFYIQYYPIIIVDEFQDTNCLSYNIITSLISDDNKVYLMGDDIQKIYNFLGAMPNLFQKMKEDFSMIPMEFSTNYRFKENSQMLELDNYLRQIFRQYDDIDSFHEKARINIGFYTSEKKEVDKIYKDISDKVMLGYDVAVLVNKKSSAKNIIDRFETEGTQYFNGLFSDTDNEYLSFHKIALESFVAESGASKSIAKRVVNKVISDIEMKKILITNDNILFNSLLRLLKALFESVKKLAISREEKYSKIMFVLSNNGLKRLMNEINENIVITTIHGSKGLEWDYIYIPQIRQGQFPVYTNNSLCKLCKEDGCGIQGAYHCEFTFPSHLKSKFEEQLSIFYVAITRAKKDAYLFANIEKNDWGYIQKRSCLTALPNLEMNRDF